jgi:hypothetical protein
LMLLTWRPIENSHEMEVNHINGDKANNTLANLEWMTRRENMLHAHFTIKSWAETQVRGEKSPHAKLTEEAVRQIRRMKEEGVSMKAMAKQFNVSPTSILYALRRITWAHVD